MLRQQIDPDGAETQFSDYQIDFAVPNPRGPDTLKGTTIHYDKVTQFNQREYYDRSEVVNDYGKHQHFETSAYGNDVEQIVEQALIMKAYSKNIPEQTAYRKYGDRPVYTINTSISHPANCSVEILVPNALIPMHLSNYMVQVRQNDSVWQVLKKSDHYDIEWGYSFFSEQAIIQQNFGIRGECDLYRADDCVNPAPILHHFGYQRVRYTIAFGSHQAIKMSIGDKLIVNSQNIKIMTKVVSSLAVMCDLSLVSTKYEVQKLEKNTIAHLEFSKVVPIKKIVKNVSNTLCLVKESDFNESDFLFNRAQIVNPYCLKPPPVLLKIKKH